MCGDCLMDDLYDLSMEMEILREMYAAQLAKFCTLFEEKGIDYEKDMDNKWVKLLSETQKRYHSILKIRTFAEAEELYKQRDIVDALLEEKLHGK